MPAYLVARVKVEDAERIKAYMGTAPNIIQQYGGKFLARGLPSATLEGPEETRRLIIIEFADLAAAQAFYHSPEYTEARRLREGIAVAEFVAIEGV